MNISMTCPEVLEWNGLWSSHQVFEEVLGWWVHGEGVDNMEVKKKKFS